MGGVRRPAGAADDFRRLRSADHRPPEPGDAVVVGQPDQHLDGVALDRGAGRRRDGCQPAGAALVMDAAAAGGVTGHPATARADRSLVGRRFARPGHQQPADPPVRGQSVGRWPAGVARPRVPRRTARRPCFAAILGDRTVVLCRDGGQRGRQRAGAGLAVGPAHHQLWTAGGREVCRAVPARPRRLAAAAHRESLRCKQIRARAPACFGWR
jgi:hypothetical protein